MSDRAPAPADVEAIAEVLHAERCVNSGSCSSIAAVLLASPALATLRAHERANALRDAADEVEALQSFAHGNNPTSKAHLIGYGTARRVIVRILRDRADRQEPQ